MDGNLNCEEALMQLLADYGIETGFGMPGTQTLDRYRGIAQAGCDSQPMLALSGGRVHAGQGLGTVHDLGDQRATLAEVVGAAFGVERPTLIKVRQDSPWLLT